MKKIAAILLLTLFIFNTVGYRLLVEYVLKIVDTNFEATLDKGNYDESELITIKVPLNVPYQTDRKEFERVNGEMNINGTVYKYVKRKVYNDTLILQCIPHEEKTKLQQEANAYYGKANDFPGNDNNKKTVAFKQLSGDYDFYSTSMAFDNHNKQKNICVFNNAGLVYQYMPVMHHPPQLSL